MTTLAARLEAANSIEDPGERLQQIVRIKCQEVMAAWHGHSGKNSYGVASFTTPQGSASIGDVRYYSDPDRLDGVEVWVGPNEGGSPTFRLINPPLLVPDPRGEVHISEPTSSGRPRVQRYRVDPLLAIAEFLAANSGRTEQG